jgi:hypothetical protein
MAIVRNISLLAIVLLLMAPGMQELHAQTSPFDSLMWTQAARIEEQVSAYTDRSLYLSGEDIRFLAHLQTTGLPEGSEWSRILHVELFSASGMQQARGKYRLQKGAASGTLRIPEGVLTGSYYLRLYTRWMRNRLPDHYAYLPLRIVNPRTEALAESRPIGQNSISLRPVTVKDAGLDFAMPSSCLRGDTVRLDLLKSGPDASGPLRGCLSIVPLVARSGDPMQAIVSADGEDFQLNFLPDRFGVTISGNLVSREGNKQPLQDSRIHFTLLGGQSAYAVAHADASGRFALTLPWREGKMEFLVQPENRVNQRMQVRIDQDYDLRTRPVDMPDFTLDEEERQTLILMARRQQLSGIYLEELPPEDAEGGEAPVPFYGTPNFSLDMDEYVLLPTLEEVLINLVPAVTPVSRRNRTDLLISSENPALGLFPPLIMIDEVPMFSMDRFFSVPTSKISRIDVVTDVYLKGNMRYGGIINLRSREGNMAGIDLPENSFFIDYEAIYPHREQLPAEAGDRGNWPDTRNTLLWAPGIRLDGPGSRAFEFMAPEVPGTYAVVFRGWDEAGRSVSAETRIIVQ